MKKSFILTAILLTITCLSIPEKNDGIKACDIILIQDSTNSRIIASVKTRKLREKPNKFNFYKNPIIFSIIQQ